MKKYLLTLMLLIGLSSYSQAILKGTITDQKQQPLEGATVFVKSLSQGTTTTENGSYELKNLPVGTYTVRVQILGYKPEERSFTFEASTTKEYNASLQEDLGNLDEVVISASRHSEYLSEIPASITVVNQKQLQLFTQATSNVSEILEFAVPGLAPATGTFSNWGQTLRGRSLLVMVDGIPQSSPLRNGQLGIKSINPNDIARVEVIKGATSIFGNGGNGGFINYITKNPDTQNAFTGSSSVWGTANLAETRDALGFGVYQSFTGNLNKFNYYVSGSYEQTGSKYDANGLALLPTYGLDNTDIYSILGKFEYEIDSNQKITLGGNLYKTEQNTPYIPVPAVVNVFNEKGDYELIAGYGIKGNIEGEQPTGTRLINGRLNYAYNNLFGGSTDFSTDVYYQNTENIFFYSDKFENGGQSAINAEKYGFRPNLNTFFDLNTTASLNLTYGVDFLHDKTNQSLLDGRMWVPNIKLSSWAPYVQSTFKFDDSWVVKAGLRYDDMNLEVDDYATLPYSGASDGNFSESVAVQGGKLGFDNLALNLGVRFIKYQEFVPYISYSQGFSIADLGSVLRSAVASNINDIALEPAVTKNYEFGFQSKFENLKFEAVGYYSTSNLGTGVVFEDALNTFVPSTQPQDIYGGEISADYFFTGTSLQLGASYSYVEGVKHEETDKNILTFLGSDIISAPKFTAYANWNPIPKLSTSIRVTNIGDRKRFDPILNTNGTTYSYKHTQFPVKGYTLVNLSVGYELQKDLTVSLAVNNLFNEYYLPARSQWASPLKTFSGAGEGANARLSLQYNF